MALNSFNISNVDALDEVACQEVPDLMIVAGPNGVGKSTLLEKLQNNRLNGIDCDENTNFVYFSPNRTALQTDIDEILLAGAKNRTFQEVLSKRTYDLGQNSLDHPSDVRELAGTRNRYRPDVAPYLGIKNRLPQLLSEKRELMDEIHTEHGHVPPDVVPDPYEPLEQAIDEILSGLEFQEVSLEGNQYVIKFQNRMGNTVEFDDLSSGEKDVITLLFLLVEDEIMRSFAEARGESLERADLVITIDGPESYLHPKLQLDFLEFAREYIETHADTPRSVQILMCTHSIMILENATSEELFFLVYPDQASDNQLFSVEGRDTEIYQAVTGELGMSALSTGKPLILVEGKDDRRVLKQFHPEIEEGADIVPMGGKQKVLQLDNAFNRLVPELEEFGIDVYALVDRDRDLNLSDEVEDRIIVLPVTCMENFLIDDIALYHALAAIVGEADLESWGITSPSDVQDLVENIVSDDDFTEHEIKRRLNDKLQFYVSPDDVDELDENSITARISEVSDIKKDRISGILESARNEVSSSVNDSDFGMLDGKEIISRVASRFDVSTDVLRMAASRELRDRDRLPDTTTDMATELSQ